MTLAPGYLVEGFDVVVHVGLPAVARPENVGKRGGRWRWWLARRADHAFRTADYLPTIGPASDRSADSPALVAAVVYPGGRYVLGLADVRYDVDVPASAGPGWSCTVTPIDPCHASIVWTGPDGTAAPPF